MTAVWPSPAGQTCHTTSIVPDLLLAYGDATRQALAIYCRQQARAALAGTERSAAMLLLALQAMSDSPRSRSPSAVRATRRA